jgi:hypothetical protein
VRRAQSTGVSVDFGTATLPAVLNWAYAQLGFVPRPIDESIPEWLAENPSILHQALLDFDEPSRHIVLTMSFYFGESFVRTFTPQLHWATGDRAAAHMNMPAVAGFNSGLEIPTILTTESMFKKAFASSDRLALSSEAVSEWVRRV